MCLTRRRLKLCPGLGVLRRGGVSASLSGARQIGNVYPLRRNNI